MKLALKYASQSDIPAGYEALYTERDGQWALTGVEGMKTEADINNLTTALTKERTEHKATKEKLSSVSTVLSSTGIEIADLPAKLDRLAELEVTAGDNKDIAARIEAAAKARTAPFERQVADLTKQNAELTQSVDTYKGRETTRAINDAVTKAAHAAGITDPNVLADVQMYGERLFSVNEDGAVVTRENAGVTPLIGPEVWLTDMKEQRPHWWPLSHGGGAGGSGKPGAGVNPFSKDGWNLTEQMKLTTADRGKAEQMAKAAGTTIGGEKPTK